MPTITIRNLDTRLKSRLRMQAALHGCSMSEEVRQILGAALSREHDHDTGENLAAKIRALFAPLGGIELKLPTRQPMREPVRFAVGRRRTSR